jgi:hypothetical protein
MSPIRLETWHRQDVHPFGTISKLTHHPGFKKLVPHNRPRFQDAIGSIGWPIDSWRASWEPSRIKVVTLDGQAFAERVARPPLSFRMVKKTQSSIHSYPSHEIPRKSWGGPHLDFPSLDRRRRDARPAFHNLCSI